MKHDQPPDDDRFEAVCLQFEDAWKQVVGGHGAPPALGPLVASVAESERSRLLRELLRLEIWYRRELGEQPLPERYHSMYPDDAKLVDEVCASVPRPAEDETADTEVAWPSSGSDDFVPPPERELELLYRLGSGKFGNVYLVMDHSLDRQVAVKVPRRDRKYSQAELAGFIEEAKKSAKLDHDHIVRVFETGSQPDGRPFVVMKYVDGGSLKQKLGGRPLPHRDAVKLLIPIAEALAHAHQCGITHRDLKPANVLLDSTGKAYVADFGLALHDDERWQRTGEFAGTPAYMAPEQVNRRTEQVDGRTDIWAMGVMLYEMLAGKLPFSAEDSRQLTQEIVSRDPKPLSMIDDAIPKSLSEY